MGKLLIAAACLLLLQSASRAEEPAADPISAKITAAKEAFYAERDKAEQALVALLEKKETAAKLAGDIKTIEAVRAELEAFRKNGTLPKSVSITAYETAMKLAKAKVTNAYLDVIKSYTLADKLNEAKITQQELDKIFGKGPPDDLFQKGSVWKQSGDQTMVLTVTKREGENFVATQDWDSPKEKRVREVTGTFKEGKLFWSAKHTRVIEGSRYLKDFTGTLTQDELGEKLDMVYKINDDKIYRFSLRLVK